MKTFIIAAMILPALAQANAPMSVQPEYELSCRIKAKETAAETYRGCITENRTAQIEQLKKEYQQKLRSMKDEYDKEIQKIGGKKAQPKPATTATAPTIQMKKKSRPAPPPPPSEDESMDMPEPIPVENVPSESTL